MESLGGREKREKTERESNAMPHMLRNRGRSGGAELCVGFSFFQRFSGSSGDGIRRREETEPCVTTHGHASLVPLGWSATYEVVRRGRMTHVMSPGVGGC